MKAQYIITQLAVFDLLYVALRRQLVGHLLVAGEAAAGQDAAQVQTLAQAAPRFVECRAHALALEVGIDVNIGPVKRIAARIVVMKIAAVGDPGIGVGAVGIATAADDE